MAEPSRGAPVPVRFVEGAVHGFLALRTLNGVLVAPGELFQVVRGGEVESRMVFRFKDASALDETVVFSQQRSRLPARATAISGHGRTILHGSARCFCDF